ncbi:molybdopterin oxidoreductase family protein [Thermococcus barophilus]|uniref:molybdopterin oxidoreductase family protein n=1 Tax=Thermococcus barophilus TaxID=55802 RepID=UPI0007048186|nr:molybdopterin-dependent oxidoreductase [Thermococcus barophilus]
MNRLISCPYCGMNCRIKVVKKLSHPYRFDSPSLPDIPNESGKRCFFGNNIIKPSLTKDRIRYPLKASERGSFIRTSWDDAIREAVVRLAEHSENPESMMFIGGMELSNESAYVFQKLARLLGTNNIDNTAFDQKISVLEVVEANAYGLWRKYSEIPHNDLIVLWGINPAESAPLLLRWVMLAKSQGAKVVLIDPHKTKTIKLSDKMLRPYPGTDWALALGVLNEIISREPDRGALFPRDSLNIIELYPLNEVSRITGIPNAELESFVDVLLTSESGTIIWGPGAAMGINSKVTVRNIISLAGILNFGIIPFARWGNSQGVLDMGLLPNYLPGYTGYDSAERFERLWKTWELPREEGKSISDAITDEISLFYIADCSGLSLIPGIENALEKAEFVIVQDSYFSEVAEFADLILPAATFIESDGSITNSERRIQWSERIKRPPGEAKPHWAILSKIGEKLKLGFSYSTPEEVLHEISTVVAGYERAAPRILKRTPEGVFVGNNTGADLKLSAGYGKDVKGKVAIFVHQFRSFWKWELPEKLDSALISPEDASEIGIRNEGHIRIKSGKWDFKVRARVSQTVLPGTVRIPWKSIFRKALSLESLKMCECEVEGVRDGEDIH